jgi:Raf kinase inhibitor-like YbhB/YbcL family protein
MLKFLSSALVVFFIASGITQLEGKTMKKGSLTIESSAFKNGQPIPKIYTCDGDDLSPPLQFGNIPEGTKSLAIIMDDPDAPNGTFDHWIAWNISSNTKELQEGAVLTFQGINSFKKQIYGGPCPPKGKPHRYFFKFYALDTMLNMPKGSSKSMLEEAIKGHILDQAELMGTYGRSE